MKRVLAAAALLALSASFAIASDDPMASRYGNTVTVTNDKGEVTKIHYKADGTLDAVQPDGTKGTAKWKMNADKLCVTPDGGPMAGKETCNAFTAGKKVGDSWEQTMADGKTKVKVAIVAGQ